MFCAVVAVPAVPTVNVLALTQLGELVPPEVKICPDVPGKLKPMPLDVEYGTAPAAAVNALPVPPYPKGTAPPFHTEPVLNVLFNTVCVAPVVNTVAPPPAVVPSCKRKTLASVS